MTGTAPTLSLFIESWPLFREPALSGAVAGALLGYLGVFIVLRRMVFVSAALSQAAGLGVTLAFYARLHLGFAGVLGSPFVGSLGVTLLVAALLMTDRTALGVRRESLLGFAYLVGGAGALVVGTRIVEEVQDVHTILFGSAVAVLPDDFRHLVWTALLLAGLHLWWRRGFVQVSFDREGAKVRGLPVDVIELALLATIAVAISTCTRILGALPVFAFSVLPAMAAVRVVANVPRALALATALGAVGGFFGYVVAFLYALPVGSSQALVSAGLVLVAEGVRVARARLAG